MGELKKLLEPVANGAGRDDDPYGVLERRRRQRDRNKRLRAGILAMVIAVGGTVFAVQAFGGDDGTTPAVHLPTATNIETLDEESLLAFQPIDPELAATRGWPWTVERIRKRAVDWYVRLGIAQSSEDQLEGAIDVLTDAWADPPEMGEPDEAMYVLEMGYRRETVCRSLPPTNPLRSDYCSPTSAPDLQGVPWYEDRRA